MKYIKIVEPTTTPEESKIMIESGISSIAVYKNDSMVRYT